MADPTWDTSKENFQPLKKGRAPKSMDEANNMRHSERATKIRDERRYAPGELLLADGSITTEVEKRVTGRRFVNTHSRLLHLSPRPQRLLGCHRKIRRG